MSKFIPVARIGGSGPMANTTLGYGALVEFDTLEEAEDYLLDSPIPPNAETSVAELDDEAVEVLRATVDGLVKVAGLRRDPFENLGLMFGDEDEGAFDAAGGEEALENQACLDGVTQADLVGEEDARYLAVGYLVEDVELVGNEVDAAAEEAANLGLAETVGGLKSAEAEIEDLGGVGLFGHEAFGGGGDTGDVGDGVFAHALAFGADVGGQAGGFLDRADGELGADAGGHGFAGGELDALQDGRAAGINAFLAGGGELDRDAGAVELGDLAEAEFGFTFTDAALSDKTKRHSE